MKNRFQNVIFNFICSIGSYIFTWIIVLHYDLLYIPENMRLPVAIYSIYAVVIQVLTRLFAVLKLNENDHIWKKIRYLVLSHIITLIILSFATEILKYRWLIYTFSDTYVFIYISFCFLINIIYLFIQDKVHAWDKRWLFNVVDSLN